MDPGTRSRRALTRALAILVVIGGFAATQQIEVAAIDALVIVGVFVAIFVAVLAGWATIRTESEERAMLLSLTEAGVFAAGALTIFGIFRTVLPASTFQEAPALGLGLVILLIIIWLVTEGGGLFPVRGRRNGGNGNGGGGNGVGGNDGDAAPARAATVSGGTRLSALQSLVAIAVVVAYGAMLYGLWINAGLDDETAWTRMIEIKSTVESVAFAALGALLGFAVQGRAAEKAEEKADQKEKDKAEALQVAKDAVSVAGGEAGSTDLETFGGDEDAARNAKVEILKARLTMIEKR